MSAQGKKKKKIEWGIPSTNSWGKFLSQRPRVVPICNHGIKDYLAAPFKFLLWLCVDSITFVGSTVPLIVKMSFQPIRLQMNTYTNTLLPGVMPCLTFKTDIYLLEWNGRTSYRSLPSLDPWPELCSCRVVVGPCLTADLPNPGDNGGVWTLCNDFSALHVYLLSQEAREL